jgi:hypothetical protein
MYRRYEVGGEQNSLSFLFALVRSWLLATSAMLVSLNVVEIGLAIWEFIPLWR